MTTQEQLLQERTQILNAIKECKQRHRYDYREMIEYDDLMNAKRKNTAELKNFNIYVLIK
jgi:hypothetical protein